MTLKQRIAITIQMALGLTLLILAVSTDFDFRNDSVVEVHIFENITARVLVPALMALAFKVCIAFAGSYLLIRRTLIFPALDLDSREP